MYHSYKGAFSCLAATILLLNLSTYTVASSIRPVSVFPWTAPALHRYSAILAAVEPFRLQRADDVKRSLGAVQYLMYKIRGKCRAKQSRARWDYCLLCFVHCIFCFVYLQILALINHCIVAITTGSDLNDANSLIRKNNFLVENACVAYEEKAKEIIRFVLLFTYPCGYSFLILMCSSIF
jgi:hypothetical protein